MLQKILNTTLGRLLLFAIIILGFYSLFKKDAEYNKYKCKTKTFALNGVIDFVSGRSGYMQAHVNNREDSFSLNVAKEIYRKGFGQYHSFEVGDSIIKAANSKEVTIKHMDSIVVFILSCGD